MADIDAALFRGVSIRYTFLSDRIWFFTSDILDILRLDENACSEIDAAYRAEIKARILGKKERIAVVSAFGVASLCVKSRSVHAPALLSFASHMEGAER